MARVPYAYVRILTEEYQEKALVVTEWEGWRWNETGLVWMKKTPDELKNDREEAARKKADDKAKKERLKAAKAKAKAKAKGMGAKPSESDDDSGLDGEEAVNGTAARLEEEPVRRLRRAAATEELVAEMEVEEEVISRATRRRERQDFL